jgi:hypothetical protein
MSDNGNPQQQSQTPIDPDSIPMEDRIATLTIVWTKTNNVLVKFPKEAHFAVKMVSIALNIVSDLVMNQVQTAVPPQSRIIPATHIPKIDPRFVKKD